LGDLNVKMLAWIVEKGPGILAQLAVWATQFITWAATTGGKLIMELGTQFGNLLTWIVAKAPELPGKLDTWGKQFMAWVARSLPGLMDELGKLWSQFQSWISATAGKLSADGSIGKALINGIKSGIDGAVQGLISAAKHAVESAMSAARSAIGSGGGGGGTSGGSTFGGGHATGGPVWPGMSYLVGEHGPELFVPSQAGGIMGAGQTAQITNNYNYAPSYNSAPQSPVADFRLMQVLAGV
jgi:hypothetical protein